MSKTDSAQSLSLLDKAITATENRLSADPKNINLLVTLCQNYLQKVRETADTEYYSKCDDLLARAVAIEPSNDQVVATQSAVAYGRHNFPAGLELAKNAVALNPNKVDYYGLLGDGQIELGRYTEAVTSFQTMVDRRPNLSSYNRVAYIRELYGDIEGAKAALRSAISAGSSYPENVAFSQVELGKLYARTDLNQAEQIFNQALSTYKDFPPALEGLGRVAFARNDYRKALQHFQQAFDDLPLAQYSTALGDTYSAMGDEAKADQQYYLAQLAFDQSSANGVNNDYELSTHLSARGEDTVKALDLAKKSLSARPNIFSSDAMAWALYHSNNYPEAQVHINEALKTGLKVPIVYFHAGMIANKLGQKEQARQYLKTAFELDNYLLESHFSLLDREAANTALEGLK
ncbi:tetratricopeptide repeat protein [Candidatus Saccharibacteria bacterium]|nr:tetratricopeptide repeat protein [Candidatus Saccharibacteria bacterium]